MRRFVLGDLHGGYRALLEVLEDSKFDKENDMLILLGDLVDGWPEVRECIDELLTLKNVVFVRGNHDHWFMDYMRSKIPLRNWTTQGGAATLASYAKDGIPKSHVAFFRSSVAYYELDNMLFVHGGFNPTYAIQLQDIDELMWNRSLIFAAQKNPKQVGEWKYIFLGHTPTSHFGETVPQQWGNIIAMDTGGGWDGPLSLMNIDTLEVYQSHRTPELYPGIRGR